VCIFRENWLDGECGVQSEVVGEAAQEVKVPNDVSVAGFDDVPEASRIEPALTTVRQDSEEKGRRAAKFLLEMLDGQAEENRHSVLAVELIVRKSTGKS
jgi:LacI family transcriptional regulator